MYVLHCHHTRPRNRTIRLNSQHPLIAHHRQETALPVSLVCHRVSREDIVGAICADMAALHRHGIEKFVSRCTELHSVPADVGGRKEKRRPLKGN